MNEMEKAYLLASFAVRRRYAEQHPEYLEALAGLRGQDVAVYSGSYDSAQNVLDLLEVPYTLDPKPHKISPRLLFANCPGPADSGLVERVEGLVRTNGTWLISSDWSLKNVVQAAFPKTVAHTGGSSADEVVSVEPWLDSMWSEVVVLGTDPQWWLEASSYPIQVLDPERVRVEAASHELLVKYKAPAVAVRFDWGEGHVFHVISHFWLKRSRVANQRHQGPCTDFLKEGLRLSDDGIAQVLKESKVKAEELNFAATQSAATSTELVAQLCVQALKRTPDQKMEKKGLLSRLLGH